MSDPEAALLRAGFAICGYCGRRMQPKFVKSNNHYRYFCGSERDTKSAGARCEGGAFSIQALYLDEMVWQWFIQAFENPDALQKKLQQWKLAQEASKALEYDRLKAIDAAQKKAEARKRNYMTSAGDAEDEEIRAEFTLLAKEAARQARELAREYKQLSTILTHHKAFQGKAESLVALGVSALDRLRSASYEDKRIALHAFKVQVKVWQKEHVPQFEISWGFDALHERWEQEVIQASKHF